MTELFRRVFTVLDSAYDRRFDTESINAARLASES